MEKNKKAVEQMTTTLQQVSEAVPKYESILEEMNLKVEILEVKSTTGVYIWKVGEGRLVFQGPLRRVHSVLILGTALHCVSINARI